jgi:hypothetical protein
MRLYPAAARKPLLDIVKIVHPLFFKYHRQQEKALMDITKDCLASTDDKTRGEPGPKGIETAAEGTLLFAIIQESSLKTSCLAQTKKRRKPGHHHLLRKVNPELHDREFYLTYYLYNRICKIQ